MYYPTPWPADGPLRASCEAASRRLAAWVRHALSWSSADHAAPRWGCQCGIYGLARPEDADVLDASPRPQRTLLADSWQVVGAVLLWGRVIQHDHGYRAEYARPVKLLAASAALDTPEARSLMEAVAQRYEMHLVSDVGALIRSANR
jgi:hypothetical protein